MRVHFYSFIYFIIFFFFKNLLKKWLLVLPSIMIWGFSCSFRSHSLLNSHDIFIRRCPPPYLVPSWKTLVVTLFQDRGPNHTQIQWIPFHLDVLCWHKSDYYLEVQPDSHKSRFCYFLQIFLITQALVTSTKMGEKYDVMNSGRMKRNVHAGSYL